MRSWGTAARKAGTPHTHARTHARTHAHTHARTHARTRARARAHAPISKIHAVRLPDDFALCSLRAGHPHRAKPEREGRWPAGFPAAGNIVRPPTGRGGRGRGLRGAGAAWRGGRAARTSAGRGPVRGAEEAGGPWPSAHAFLPCAPCVPNLPAADPSVPVHMNEDGRRKSGKEERRGQWDRRGQGERSSVHVCVTVFKHFFCRGAAPPLPFLSLPLPFLSCCACHTPSQSTATGRFSVFGYDRKSWNPCPAMDNKTILAHVRPEVSPNPKA